MGGPGTSDPSGVLLRLRWHIAAVIDGPRRLPDGTYSCPTAADSAMMLTAMRLTFRIDPGGPMTVTAGADYVARTPAPTEPLSAG